MSDDVKVVSSALLPGKTANNVRGPLRGSAYGEQFVSRIADLAYSQAQQGTYFTAHNTTNDASTTLAGFATTKLADSDATMTRCFIHCRMNPTSTKRAYFDFIEIEVVTAAATGGSASWAAQLDTGATRVTTAGTALTTLNTNMQVGNTAPDLAPQAGPIVVGVESSNVRNLGFGTSRAAIEFAGDRTTYRFGNEPGVGDNVVAGAASRFLISMPPVILGPSDQFLLAMYDSTDAQNAAGVYKVRMGWWEL